MTNRLGSPPTRGGRVLRRAFAIGGVSALVASGFSALGPGTSSASSHREAPLIGGDPRADNTDVYAFVSPDEPDMVTLIANWIPFEEPNGGPNFYPFAEAAHYNIKIDNDGDAVPDLVYTWTFTDNYRDEAGQILYNTGPVNSVQDPTLNFFQTYDLTLSTDGGEPEVLVDDAIAAPSNVGEASMPNYQALRDEAVVPLADGAGQTFAGQADDSFFIDLRVFDLLYGTDLSETGSDTLSGYNVNSVALQIPQSALATGGDATANPVVGIWSSTDREGADVFSAAEGATTADGFVQVSRLGNPLVNELVVPLQFKDAFNGLTPDLDATIQPVVDSVLDPILPGLVQQIYNLPAPAAPRNDLFEIFLTGICTACAGPDGNVALPIDLNSQMLNADAATFVPSEMLRLNMSIPPTADPNRLGVLAMDNQGYPNGRRLTDDVVDISLQTVMGAAQTGQLVEALAAGDAVDTNDLDFGDSFPYLALPHGASVNVAAVAGASGSEAVGSSSTGSSSSGQGAPAGGAPAGGVAAGAGGTADGSTPVVPISLAVAVVMLTGAGLLSVRRRQPLN